MTYRLSSFLIFALVETSIICHGWLLIPQNVGLRQRCTQKWQLHSEIVDAEFELVEKPDERNDMKSNRDDDSKEQSVPEGSKSLFDVALESDPDVDWKDTPIPFFYGDKYIDAKLAFMAEVDGIKYGIALPHEHAVAMTLEKKDGSVDYLTPDTDDNEELMEIMATQVHQHLGKEFKLKHTPRVLTISGPLEKYTENWQDKLFPDTVDTDDLLDESNEDLDFFHNFMKKELGEEEYEKTLEESKTADISEELQQLFEIPGFGSNVDDEEGIEEMFQSIFDGTDKQLDDMQEVMGKDISHEGVALKLISYLLPGGKSYSLVKMLKPYVLVARYNFISENDVQFELLSPEEEKTVIPRLEQVCKEDFEKAGLIDSAKNI